MSDNRQTKAVFISFQQNVDVPKRDGGTYKGYVITATVNGELKKWAKPMSALKFNKQLERQLNSCNKGENITILEVKENGFLNLTGVIKGEDTGMEINSADTGAGFTTPPRSSSSTSSGSRSFETAEERAAKQVFIIRQSSLSTATDFVAAIGDKKATPETVIAVAKTFEAYVLGKAEEGQSKSDASVSSALSDAPFEDDLPFL